MPCDRQPEASNSNLPDYAITDRETLRLAEAILLQVWLGGAEDVPEPGGADWLAGVAVVALRLAEDEGVEQDMEI